MNAAEFNTALNELFGTAIAEGVVPHKMAFETMIGIIDCQKHSLLTWNQRAKTIASAAAQSAPPTIFKPGEE